MSLLARVSPELAPLALLWALATGHPDAWLLKQFADSAHVPAVVVWAVAAVESGHGPNNHARGKHGEIGRMQIKRLHEGSFRRQCGPKPLTDYTTNVCVGAHLLRMHYEATGSWRAAIQRFNGRGPNTVRYLVKVEQAVGRIELRLLEVVP